MCLEKTLERRSQIQDIKETSNSYNIKNDTSNKK